MARYEKSRLKVWLFLNKKVKRSMLERKSQYIGSLVLIIISCMVFTMLNQLASNLENISSSFEKNYVLEDASFITDQKPGNIPELESKFGMKIQETATFDYPVSKDKTLRIFSLNDKVDIPAIIEGKGLENSGGILLDPAYAKANKLRIGDRMDIGGKPFVIAGFMSLPNYIYPVKNETDLLTDPKSFGVAVVARADFRDLDPAAGSFYSIRFNNDSDVSAVTAQFKDYLKSQGIIILKWTDAGDNLRIVTINAKIDGMNKVSTSLPVVILLLTCILTCIVMWRLLKLESVSIGTLYALGYRKKEIMRHYMTYPLSVAISGGILGTVLGALLLKPMISVFVGFFNLPVISVSYSTGYVLASILLPVVFLYICSYFVTNRILESSPVDLMKGGKEKGKVGLLERSLKLESLKFPSKFKLREQLRSIPRSMFLLFGVILATMLLLLGFTAMNSMNFLMKDTFEATYKYQYQYVFNTLQFGQPAGGEAFSTSPFTLASNGKTLISVAGINPSSKYISLKDKAGNSISTGKTIATRALADSIGLKEGDTVQLINKLDSRQYEITIDRIAETYVGEYIYMPLAQFNRMLKYPSDSYIGLYSANRLDIPGSKLMSTTTLDDMKSAFANVIQPIQSVVGVLSLFSFIIGLLVIYVVTSLVIEENKQSISLMKVLGYRRKELGRLILNSSSYLVVIGYILGIPLLLATLGALFKSITADLNMAIPITMNYAYTIAGFAVIYLTYEISKALSRKKLDRISMNESLKAVME